MRRKIYSQLFVIMLLLTALFTSGCGQGFRFGATMIRDAIESGTLKFNYSIVKWHTLEIKQGDGKTFAIDLPFELDPPRTYPDGENKKNEELYTYKNIQPYS